MAKVCARVFEGPDSYHDADGMDTDRKVHRARLVLWLDHPEDPNCQVIETSPMDEWDAYNLLVTLAEGLRTSENSHYAALGRGICEADHKLHAVRADRVGEMES